PLPGDGGSADGSTTRPRAGRPFGTAGTPGAQDGRSGLPRRTRCRSWERRGWRARRLQDRREHVECDPCSEGAYWAPKAALQRHATGQATVANLRGIGQPKERHRSWRHELAAEPDGTGEHLAHLHAVAFQIGVMPWPRPELRMVGRVVPDDGPALGESAREGQDPRPGSTPRSADGSSAGSAGGSSWPPDSTGTLTELTQPPCDAVAGSVLSVVSRFSEKVTASSPQRPGSGAKVSGFSR